MDEPDPLRTAFDERISTRSARVGIVGLGYAGLPLAMAFAEAGFDVTGIDLNRERVEAIADGRSYLVDVPAERYTAVDGRLEATTDYSVVSAARRADDLRADAAVEDAHAGPLLRGLRGRVGGRAAVPGQLVILQSTTYPGTTEQVIRPILERAGAVVGQDLFLGYAPERVDPGNRHGTCTRRRSSSAASRTSACGARSCSTRRSCETVVPVSSPMVAETAKLHENTFRAVNIALANELA